MAIVAGLLAPSDAYGAGELDPTFDGDGKVVTDFGANEEGGDIAIQPDGKIVVAGGTGARLPSRGNFALARYNTDGSLDTSFGGDGRVVTHFGALESAEGVAIQADGKIVAAGVTTDQTSYYRFALARYNADGSLDTTFDGDGRVVTDFGGEGFAFGVAIQPDGKIVAGGGSSCDFALARYNADGSLDTTFDGDGRVVTDFGDCEYAWAGAAVQADGKIVAAGYGHDPSADCCNDFALARYNRDGSLDTTFGNGGTVLSQVGAGAFAQAVGIQGDGKIVAAGGASSADSLSDDFALARYNADGSGDQSFSGDGEVLTDFGADEIAAGLAIEASGRIVAAGDTTSGGCCHPNFAVARYHPDGSLDSTFDADGMVVTDFGASARARGVALQPDGKIVAAGGSSGDFALARYLPGPQIRINDVRRFEGNAGLTAFTFTVSLSPPSPETITISRQHANGSATAPSDYTALAPATITFLPGQTTKKVTVNVKGELAIEPDETFFVNLSTPTNAAIADGQGKATILNDDLSDSAPCRIIGTNRDDVLNGTPGNDVICGRRGNDQIYGLDGNDVLKGEDGDDLLVGGNGYDLLLAAVGFDDLRGEGGNDTLRAGDGGDTLNGGANSDGLFGDAGADSLNTQDGVSANDSADGGTDSDSCLADPGDFVTNCP